MNDFTSTRANPLVDPGLHVWHGEVAGYLFLGGLVAGIMILAGLRLRAGARGGAVAAAGRPFGLLPWAAPVLLSVGMLFLWLDLENPWNAFRFYLVLRPAAPMSWGAWILLGIYPASVALAWLSTPARIRDSAMSRLDARIGARLPRVMAWMHRADETLGARSATVGTVNVLGGAALGIYTGLLLGTMAARPLWNSAMLGPLFLVSGLSTGAAFLLLWRLDEGERIRLARLDMGLIAAELALVAVWLVGLSTGGAASRQAAHAVLGGPWTTAFWTLVVALGLVAPVVAEGMELRHGRPPGRLAAALVLLGGFALRWILVYAGQHAGLGDTLAFVGGTP